MVCMAFKRALFGAEVRAFYGRSFGGLQKVALNWTCAHFGPCAGVRGGRFTVKILIREARGAKPTYYGRLTRQGKRREHREHRANRQVEDGHARWTASFLSCELGEFKGWEANFSLEAHRRGDKEGK